MVAECSAYKMPASRKFTVMAIRLFYASTRLYGLVAIAMSSHADGNSFETYHIGTLIAPSKSADVAYPQGLEYICFAPHGGCVVRCLPYHARSFD
ncbi:MAG: hypothetical protein CBC82_00190 [Cellvibrionales bacterium TMED122]|nr:MAG: hypothetical protein CBC82_00190 [Cellvibrionales bacterium TMED122]